MPPEKHTMTQPNQPTVNVDLARQALRLEGQCILRIADRIGDDFASAARAVHGCPGTVVLTGIGKAGIIARKISATFASTGTPSIFLHPVEALHGDLGRVGRGDVMIMFSHSGTTDEIIRLVDHVKGRDVTLIAVSGTSDNPLGKHADIRVAYGDVQEACPLGLAPTVSTACMLALGDALAVTVMAMRKFTPEEFAGFHPGGALGRKLLRVEEAMIQGQRLTAVRDDQTLAQALAQAEQDRRAGAMLLVDAEGRLSGILTDADLRRLLAHCVGADEKTGGSTPPSQDILSRPVRDVMTTTPKHIRLGELASKAQAIMNRHRIDELPVLDANGKPVGIVDIQDLLGIKTVNTDNE